MLLEGYFFTLFYYCVKLASALYIYCLMKGDNMAGRFMSKEKLHEEADRLGVDIEGLKWAQQQKVVLDALDTERAGHEFSARAMDEIVEAVKEVIPSQEITVHVDVDDYDFMERVRGKKLIICPEMAQTPRQLFGYEEELGDELIVEEVTYSPLDGSISGNNDLATSTFAVKGKTGKKVIAQSALPKEGCGITFRPDVDWFPVCTFQGREGYLWTHHRLPNVKATLIASGYYEDYRERFKDEPWIWHSGGKLLACDINLVHSVMREIERLARDQKVQDAQRSAFIDSQMERNR